jgi:hypothetical protein
MLKRAIASRLLKPSLLRWTTRKAIEIPSDMRAQLERLVIPGLSA